MSHESIYQASEDQSLRDRIVAAAQKEAQNNPTVSGTGFAQSLKTGPGNAWVFYYPVAIDYEAEYAYAIGAGNPDPGGDRGVISDENISAAVVAHWPPDPVP